jgi:hypothetical protein
MMVRRLVLFQTALLALAACAGCGGWIRSIKGLYAQAPDLAHVLPVPEQLPLYKPAEIFYWSYGSDAPKFTDPVFLALPALYAASPEHQPSDTGTPSAQDVLHRFGMRAMLRLRWRPDAGADEPPAGPLRLIVLDMTACEGSLALVSLLRKPGTVAQGIDGFMDGHRLIWRRGRLVFIAEGVGLGPEELSAFADIIRRRINTEPTGAIFDGGPEVLQLLPDKGRRPDADRFWMNYWIGDKKLRFVLETTYDVPGGNTIKFLITMPPDKASKDEAYASLKKWIGSQAGADETAVWGVGHGTDDGGHEYTLFQRGRKHDLIFQASYEREGEMEFMAGAVLDSPGDEEASMALFLPCLGKFEKAVP